MGLCMSCKQRSSELVLVNFFLRVVVVVVADLVEVATRVAGLVVIVSVSVSDKEKRGGRK